MNLSVWVVAQVAQILTGMCGFSTKDS